MKRTGNNERVGNRLVNKSINTKIAHSASRDFVNIQYIFENELPFYTFAKCTGLQQPSCIQ